MSLNVEENVVWNAVEGELVLLNANTGTYFALDGVGADVWRLLAERKEVPQIKERLLEIYDVDEATLSTDVDRLIGELKDAKLIAEAPAAA